MTAEGVGTVKEVGRFPWLNNIKCSIHKAGKFYRIYILAKSVETVKLLIMPFMHYSMNYMSPNPSFLTIVIWTLSEVACHVLGLRST